MNPQVYAVIGNIMSWLQLAISVGAVIGLIKALGGTISAPNRKQDERLNALEDWREKVDARLELGNNHFDSIDDGNRIMQESMLALMRHAINGNDVDKLKEAESKLEKYLIDK